jgi:sugar phosphate isomerase/epimerase
VTSPVDPRISLSGVSTWNWTLDEDIALCERHGVPALGVSCRKLLAADGDGARRLRDSGVRASNLIETGAAPLDEVFDLARAVGAPLVVLTSGAPNGRTWEEAAEAFGAALSAPTDVRVLLEHTNPFRVDLSFVHTLRDAVDLAARLGIGVCMEVNACWMERGLQATIGEAVAHSHLGLVQVSDFVIGTRCTPDRAVPGDGDIPLPRIIADVLAAGYAGFFDIELVGPKIEAEGYERAVTRSLAYVSELLRAIEQPTR